MSDELRFKRKANMAEAACFVLVLAVTTAVFGSLAGLDVLGIANNFFGAVANALQELLGIF